MVGSGVISTGGLFQQRVEGVLFKQGVIDAADKSFQVFIDQKPHVRHRLSEAVGIDLRSCIAGTPHALWRFSAVRRPSPRGSDSAEVWPLVTFSVNVTEPIGTESTRTRTRGWKVRPAESLAAGTRNWQAQGSPRQMIDCLSPSSPRPSNMISTRWPASDLGGKSLNASSRRLRIDLPRQSVGDLALVELVKENLDQAFISRLHRGRSKHTDIDEIGAGRFRRRRRRSGGMEEFAESRTKDNLAAVQEIGECRGRQGNRHPPKRPGPASQAHFLRGRAADLFILRGPAGDGAPLGTARALRAPIWNRRRANVLPIGS